MPSLNVMHAQCEGPTCSILSSIQPCPVAHLLAVLCALLSAQNGNGIATKQKFCCFQLILLASSYLIINCSIFEFMHSYLGLFTLAVRT